MEARMPLPTWDNLPLEKRDRVLEAGAREFGRAGFSAGSLNTIAREAGIAKGSLFQYFGDKLDLYAHICDVVSERVRTAMERRMLELDPGRPFFDFVTDAVVAWVEWFDAHPVERGVTAATNLEMDPAARSAVRRVAHAHYLDALRPLLGAAVERGDIRPDADLEALTAYLLLVLPHLALARNLPDLDPVLGLASADPVARRDAAVRLVDVLRAAYATEPAPAHVGNHALNHARNHEGAQQ
jgi:AcrR family transcriptional regulator